jgi:hypothetical protein
MTGGSWLGIRALQSRGILAAARSRGYMIRPVADWGAWAETLWHRFRDSCSFGVLRDRQTLVELYPAADPRLLRFLIERDGEPVGWTVCFNSQMKDHAFFGKLRVATILDCIAAPEHASSLIALTTRALDSANADLVVSNQTHRSWLDAFRRCGFLTSKSNYLLAMSPALAQDANRSGSDRIHVTRGDGDGRIHL